MLQEYALISSEHQDASVNTPSRTEVRSIPVWFDPASVQIIYPKIFPTFTANQRTKEKVKWLEEHGLLNNIYHVIIAINHSVAEYEEVVISDEQFHEIINLSRL